ncbi:unnamed protein product [Vicia faba]|uniref:P-type ATPase C-terminal domain-containing protein n=1 Tax=Vicia faba TaxID=3906 RepID=A0AAV1AG48_VICFA|nr:unnamed protein product [Vicia faba]
MADTLWQSMVIFWPPLFAYWKSTVDVASIGDLWTLAVVIIVNLHLAMDVVRRYWVTHAVIWGYIAATFIAVMIIDAIPKLLGFWAFFHEKLRQNQRVAENQQIEMLPVSYHQQSCILKIA